MELEVWIFVLSFYVEILITVKAQEISLYVKPQMTAVLKCPYGSHSDPLIWRGPPNFTTYSIDGKINKNIAASDRTSISGNFQAGEYVLSIENFTKYDTGRYRCDTANDERAIVHEILLNIAEPPKNVHITNQTKSGMIYCTEGFPVTLECNVQPGKPTGNLTWIYKDEELINTINRSVSYTFNVTRRMAMENYTCEASNGFYTIAKRVQLNVYVSPEVTVTANADNIDEGSNATLVCKADTNVYPIWSTWLFNDTQVIGTNQSLLILPNIKRHDTGNYTCTVNNHIGNGSATITINVRYKPFVVDTEHNYRFNIQSEVGKPSIISLKIGSETKPEISWTSGKGGKQGYWKVQLLFDNVYLISSTIVPHEENQIGDYSVKVRNIAGSVDILFILVRYFVSVYPTEPQCNMSNHIELTCNVSATNTSQLANVWTQTYGTERVRTIPGEMKNGISMLTIQYCDYRDSGVYTCKWSSTTESFEANSTVIVHSYPVLASKRHVSYAESVILEIKFFSDPKPITVSWFYKDRVVKNGALTNQQFRRAKVRLPFYKYFVDANGYKAIATINSSYEYDINLFSCQITNEFGHLDVSFDTSLDNIELSTTVFSGNVENSPEMTPMIYTGIASGLVLVIILFVIILYFAMRYKHNHGFGNTSCKDQNQTSNIDELQGNDSLSNNASYEEIEVYYHDVSWRTYDMETENIGNQSPIASDNSSTNAKAHCTYEELEDKGTDFHKYTKCDEHDEKETQVKHSYIELI